MKNQNAVERENGMKTVKERYKTAQLLVSSNDFKAGEFVEVKYYWTDENGVDWYLIGMHGNTVYPEHHLTRLTLQYIIDIKKQGGNGNEEISTEQ